MHFSVNTQSELLDSISSAALAAVDMVSRSLGESWTRFVNKTCLEKATKLKCALTFEQTSQIISSMSHSALKDGDIWQEVLEGIDGQMKHHGIPLLVEYIASTNKTKQQEMYQYLLKLIPSAAANTGYRESISFFVVAIRKLLEEDEKNPGSRLAWASGEFHAGSLVNTLLYTLKHLLYQLQEQSPAELLKSVEELVNSKVLLWSNETSQNNASKILEFCIKEALKNGKTNTFNQILDTIDKMHPKPAEIFFNKVLDYMVKHSLSIKYSEQLLSVMIKNRVKASLITFNTLLDLYVSQRNFQMADYLFDSLCTNNDPIPDNFTFSIMISSVKYRHPLNVAKALELFDLYKERLPVDLVIVNCLLDVFASLGEQGLVYQLVEDTKADYGLTLDHVSYNTLIKECARRGDTKFAEDLFKDMIEAGVKPSKITFNSLMDICVKSKDLNRAMHYLKKMKESGIDPDQFSYSIVFTGIKNTVKDDSVYNQTFACLEGLIEADDFIPDEIFFNTMMDVSVKFKDLNKTTTLFQKMLDLNIQPSSVSYGILIKAYGKAGLADKAQETFFQMRSCGIDPNDVTYGCLIEAFLNGDELARAEKVFNELPEKKITVNPVLLSTMIKGYSRKGAYSQAISLFDRIVQGTPGFKPNLVCYNCIIDVATRKKNIPLAFHYLEELQNQGLRPDMITYSILIKGLCQERNCTKAALLLNQMIAERITPDLTIFNLIMETSSDPHEATKGIEVFETLLSSKCCQPNQVTFGIVVKLYGFTNQISSAFKLLDIMKSCEVAPSVIFFTNLIHICFSNGELIQAKKAFTMVDDYGLQPDQICWNKYILGLTRNRDVESAVDQVGKAIELGFEIRTDILEKMAEKLSKMGKRYITQLNFIRKTISKSKLQASGTSKLQTVQGNSYNKSAALETTTSRQNFRAKGTFGAEISVNSTPLSSAQAYRGYYHENSKVVVNQFSGASSLGHTELGANKGRVPVIVGDPKEIPVLPPKSAEKPPVQENDVRAANQALAVAPIRRAKLTTASKDFVYPVELLPSEQFPGPQTPATVLHKPTLLR